MCESVTYIFLLVKICCSEIGATCGPTSFWAPAPIMHWGPTTVQLSASMCPPTEAVAVAALRYAWRDWPCDFKACPIYSASRILPAPPFIIHHSPKKTNIGEAWRNQNLFYVHTVCKHRWQMNLSEKRRDNEDCCLTMEHVRTLKTSTYSDNL